MNFDDIQKTWQSPLNRPSAVELESEKMKFLAELRKRNRGAVIFMLWILAVLTFLTGRVVLHLLWPDPSKEVIDLSREWAVIPLLVLPWIALAIFYRKHRAHRARNPDSGRSISASVRALLDENRIARERHRWVSLLSGAMVLLMPLIVYQLRGVGKAGDEILIPAFVLLPILMLGIFLGMKWHDRRVLLPRKRQLESLLATYDQRPGPAGP